MDLNFTFFKVFNSFLGNVTFLRHSLFIYKLRTLIANSFLSAQNSTWHRSKQRAPLLSCRLSAEGHLEGRGWAFKCCWCMIPFSVQSEQNNKAEAGGMGKGLRSSFTLTAWEPRPRESAEQFLVPVGREAMGCTWGRCLSGAAHRPLASAGRCDGWRESSRNILAQTSDPLLLRVSKPHPHLFSLDSGPPVWAGSFYCVL